MLSRTLSLLLVGLLLVLSSVLGQTDPTYDHQTVTYKSYITPLDVSGSTSVTPFFSPDHSVDTETYLVGNATSVIRIAIPGFDSWGECTDTTNGIYGCTVKEQRSNESFPIFAALVNALSKGVTVKILTNNYNQTYTPGYIDPLAFLKLAGADVRYFTTVTFIHTKYISTDGSTAAVSSVNFSQTSFMKNREAGVLIDDSTLIAYYDKIFEADFAEALAWVTLTYSAADMKIIEDKSLLPVVIPPPVTFSGAYVTSLTKVTGSVSSVGFASPDEAYDTITKALEAASEVNVYIYQITDIMCDFVSNHTSIFNQILVSADIYDEADYESAQQCYTRLYNQGMKIKKTAKYMYTYSHQKYWIIDGKTVFLSTGNWGDTDYPDGSSTFPPYGDDGWRLTNRDFTISIVNADIIDAFQKVLDEDYERGYDYYPEA